MRTQAVPFVGQLYRDEADQSFGVFIEAIQHQDCGRFLVELQREHDRMGTNVDTLTLTYDEWVALIEAHRLRLSDFSYETSGEIRHPAGYHLATIQKEQA